MSRGGIVNILVEGSCQAGGLDEDPKRKFVDVVKEDMKVAGVEKRLQKIGFAVATPGGRR